MSWGNKAPTIIFCIFNINKTTENKMNIEIIVRKPKTIKFFGIGKHYDRYTNRWYKWMKLLPNNGEKIKITWFPNNRGVINAYIGFVGVVEGMNKIEGTFCLNSGHSILICKGDFNYIKL